jgi:hypothetical protein
MDLKVIKGPGLDSSGSGRGPMIGYYELDIKRSDFIVRGELLD